VLLDFGSVKCQAKPSTIYTSTKTEEELLSALQRNGLDCSHSFNYYFKLSFDSFVWNHTDSNDEAPVVKLMKSSTFSYEQAWHRFAALCTVYLITRPGLP
jgi:DNA mismatch repair protein MSH5